MGNPHPYPLGGEPCGSAPRQQGADTPAGGAGDTPRQPGAAPSRRAPRLDCEGWRSPPLGPSEPGDMKRLHSTKTTLSNQSRPGPCRCRHLTALPARSTGCRAASGNARGLSAACALPPSICSSHSLRITVKSETPCLQ